MERMPPHFLDGLDWLFIKIQLFLIFINLIFLLATRRSKNPAVKWISAFVHLVMVVLAIIFTHDYIALPIVQMIISAIGFWLFYRKTKT